MNYWVLYLKPARKIIYGICTVLPFGSVGVEKLKTKVWEVNGSFRWKFAKNE